MKKFKSIVSIIIVLTLIIATPVFGQGNNGKNNSANPGKGQDKSWKEAKELLKEERDALKAQEHELKSRQKELEKQLKEVKKGDNKEQEEQLRIEILGLEKLGSEIKNEKKNTGNLMKEVARNKYSIEELEELKRIGEELEETDEDVTVLPVENINTKNRDIKFDTPPVIKEGRVLIPVRAITQGFGADLEWDPEEKKVTITKGDKEIILHLDSNIAIVDGEEVELGVTATAFNNRTYVPLRFIIENLGLKIDYDEDTGLIEIEDEENMDEDEEEIDDELEEEDVEEVEEEDDIEEVDDGDHSENDNDEIIEDEESEEEEED